jgi:hypothetical protein
LELSAFAAATLLDGRHGPGARAVGIRLADARSGGRPTRRQAVVRVGTHRAWQAVTTRLLPWPKVRPLHEDEGVRSELEAVRLEYADDQEALNDAIMRTYQQRQVDPVRASCLPLLLRIALAAAIDAPVWSPLKQSLPDRLASTVVIVER